MVFITNEKGVVFSKTKFGLKEQLKTELAIFACHGGFGENGRLVSIFESFGIYSNVGEFDSLAVCMNKLLFKQVMNSLKIPVVDGVRIFQDEFYCDKEKVLNKIEKLGFPLILKPNNGGSSIGLFVVNNRKEFEQQINNVFEFDKEVLIEKYISKTREFNIAIMGDRNSYNISEIDEPIKEHEVLTFSDKYLAKDNLKTSKIRVNTKNSMANTFRNYPAQISDDLSKKIKEYASIIFKELNLRGVVRIDFLYCEEYDCIYVCEVNSIPGSLAFYFFNNGEYLLNDFVLNLINIAEKYKDNIFSINKNFITNILK